MESLVKKILAAGINNCLFLVRIGSIVIPMRIEKQRFRVTKNLQIGLISEYRNIPEKFYYTSDLENLVKKGEIEFFVKQ